MSCVSFPVSDWECHHSKIDDRVLIRYSISFFFFKLNDNKTFDINQLNSVDIKGIRDNIFILAENYNR